MEDFLTLAHERYSCRSFDGRPVERKKIDKIIEAAMAAPSACNKQPWHAWVLESEDALAKLRPLTRFHFDAPLVILLGAYPQEAWVRKFDGLNAADIDTSIVGTHILLAVTDQGLGATWVAHFDAPAVKEAFPETAEYNLVALFPIGYPAPDATPAPLHERSRPEGELVSWL